MVNLALRKIYKNLELHEHGKIESLDDILPIVQKFYPGAFLEGNAGPERSYFVENINTIIAYAWYTHRLGIGKWNYLVFKHPQKW